MIEPRRFRGFDKASSLMWSYEARARVYAQLSQTDFLVDETVASVHIDNTSRVDRAFLTAFDASDRQVGADILFVDDPSQRLDVTPEFDHDYTKMPVKPGSELAHRIARGGGWVVDLEPLRNYDLFADRATTQRAVFLAHLEDMISSGQASAFVLKPPDEPEAV